MATKIRKRTNPKKEIRLKRKLRSFEATRGTAERPRLVVYRSNAHLYAQIIDDVAGSTLAAAATSDAGVGAKANVEGAKKLGASVAQKAKLKNISSVVFDRNGFLYHGKIKALADSARENGLVF